MERIRVVMPLYCGNDVNLQEGKSDTYSQGINTGGNCQQEHGFHIQRSGGVFFIHGHSFFDHGSADDTKQYESNPVIDSGDKAFKLTAENIADHGHQRLKTTKP